MLEEWSFFPNQLKRLDALRFYQYSTFMESYGCSSGSVCQTHQAVCETSERSVHRSNTD